MRITLRDAHKLDTKIKTKLSAGYKTRHSLAIYQDEHHSDANWLDIQQEDTAESVDQYLDLIHARYWIRSSVQALNDEVGINTQVTDRACLREKQVVLKDLIETSDLDDFSITGSYLAGRREAMKTAGGVKSYDYGSSSDRFSVNTIGDDTYTFARQELKALNRKLDEIENTLASLNAGTKIVLPESIVTVLTAADLV